MHHPKAFTIRRPSVAMKKYVEGAECRRKTLLFNFSNNEPDHTFTCCDICDKDSPSWVETAIKGEASRKSNLKREVTCFDKN